MYKSKEDYELHYWLVTKPNFDFKVYDRYLAAWKVDRQKNLGDVLEVGTGPYCGCLPLLSAKSKVALDPLFKEYRELGLLKLNEGIELVTGVIEKIDETSLAGRTFDTVLTANALDHGSSDFSSLLRISSVLKAGGLFFMHVHLRTPQQLNFGHDHSLNLGQLEEQSKKAGLVEVWKRVEQIDPVLPDAAFLTVIGCWQKA